MKFHYFKIVFIYAYRSLIWTKSEFVVPLLTLDNSLLFWLLITFYESSGGGKSNY